MSDDVGRCAAIEVPLPARSEGAPGSASRKSAIRGSSPKCNKRVSFPSDDSLLVTGYLEPVNPWQDVSEITADKLVEAYLDSCVRHYTNPIAGVVEQIKSYEGKLCNVACGTMPLRLPRLSISETPLGISDADALEAILKRVQFDRLDIDHCSVDDDTAVSLFDMIEYYESAIILNISGNTDFGIRGWQACSRMIKKSQHLRELEACSVHPGEAYSAVLGRALKATDCRLRALRLPRANLSSRPLLCLVSALRQNTSVRELQLCDNGLSVDDAEQLGSLLAHNTTLQLLDVSNNDIQDVGLYHITEGLVKQGLLSGSSTCQGFTGSSSTSPSSPESNDTSPLSPQSGAISERGLAVLVLWNNNLTRNCANHLSRALTRSRSLCVLNVGQNALGSEAVRSLTHALRPSARDTARDSLADCGGVECPAWQPPSLLCLGLQAARLGATAAVAVADVLRENNVIQRIDMRDNRLQLIGLQALAAAMETNLTATQIDLDNVPALDDSLESLEMCKLCTRIRDSCRRNEMQRSASISGDGGGRSARRRRRSLIAERKISLTCQTLYSQDDHNNSKQSPVMNLEPAKRTEKGRLRSPLPSPVPSPISSPVPSPSRGQNSRFHVMRVSADSPLSSDRSSTDSSSPSTPTQSPRQVFFNASRFKVVQVTEPSQLSRPPVISVQPPVDTNVGCIAQPTSRFRVTRNLDSAFDRKPAAKEADKPLKAKKDLFSDTSMPTSDTIEQMAAITEDLGNLIQEMKETSNKAVLARRSGDATNSDRVPDALSTNNATICDSVNKDIEDSGVPLSIVTVESKPSAILKKNKSESSLDSPDLEVSRYMHMQKQAFYDSNSSLDVSGSSVESLNGVEMHHSKDVLHNEVQRQTVQEPDATFAVGMLKTGEPVVEQNRELINEYEEVFSVEPPEIAADADCVSAHQHLHSSISSNESVSPNIFGKHVKLHGSLSSLEASMNSMDSYRETAAKVRVHTPPLSELLHESADSGYEYSENAYEKPPEARSNESTSSNEGTLTYNSPISDTKPGVATSDQIDLPVIDTIKQSESDNASPKRTCSLLDVPSMNPRAAGTGRVRKISWVAPSASFGAAIVPSQSKPEVEENTEQSTSAAPPRGPSSLEKLLSLFQHPSSLFSRSSDESIKSMEIGGDPKAQPPLRKDYQNSQSYSGTSFWSWGLGVPVQSSPRINRDECISPFRTAPQECLTRLPEQFEPRNLSDNQTRLTSSSTKADERTNLNPSTNISDLKPTNPEVVQACVGVDVALEQDEGVAKSSTVQNDCNLDLREHKVTDFIISNSDISDSKLPPEGVSSVVPSELVRDLVDKATIDLTVRRLTHSSLADDSGRNERLSSLMKLAADAVSPGPRLRGADAVIAEEENVHVSKSLLSPLLDDLADGAKRLEIKERESDSILSRSPRPRTFASVLKQSAENGAERMPSPETGPSVADLPIKVIKGIKENISPENTLTSSMTNTKALAEELHTRRVLTGPRVKLDTVPDKQSSIIEAISVPSTAYPADEGNFDVAKDALVFLAGPHQQITSSDLLKSDDSNVAQSKVAPEMVVHLAFDDSLATTTTTECLEYVAEMKVKHVERFLLKKASSAECLVDMITSQEGERDARDDALRRNNTLPMADIPSKTVQCLSCDDSFDCDSPAPSLPKDIPVRRFNRKGRSPSRRSDRSASGCSSNSLPDAFSHTGRSFSEALPKVGRDKKAKKRTASGLGKIARDSLYALNMTEEELAEFRNSARLASVESLRSLESVSEDAAEHGGCSAELKCRSCARTSQESLMSLDSISEDGRSTVSEGDCPSKTKRDLEDSPR